MRKKTSCRRRGSSRYCSRLLFERLEDRVVLSAATDVVAPVGYYGAELQAALDTPPVIVGSGIPDVTVNEDAADTFIRLRDWFDDQPGGPAGLTFEIQSVNPPAAAIFSSTLIEIGMADTRTDFTATRLASGKVLVTGGFFYDGAEPITLASAELYDPVSQTWSLAAPLHVARTGHEATLLANGLVLVTGGGVEGGAPFASAEVYNSATNTWTVVNPMTTERVQHTATILINGKVLVVGGTGSDAATSAELYDPATNTWSAAGALATWRTTHTATALSDGSVLVVGGLDADGNYLADAERYDPLGNTWSAAGTLSDPRQNHTATLLNDGTVLVTGGSSDGTNAGVNLAERYNPVNNTWATFAPMGEPRLSHTATLLADGRVLVVGGENGTGPTVDTAEIYDPLLNDWSPVDTIANARSGHGAMLLGDGSVLIAGGLDFPHGFPPDTLATSELFSPGTGQWTGTAPQLRLGYVKDEFGAAQVTIRATDAEAAFVDDTFQVTVNPVNDRPTFDPGVNQSATDENPLTHGPAPVQSVVGWAANLDKGAANEADQTLIFTVTNNNTALFTAAGQPAIDAGGTMTYTPAPNAHGTALVTVTVRDDGGTEFGGINTGPTEQLFITITKPMVRHNSAPTANPQGIGMDVTSDTLGPPDGYISPGDALAVINHINAFDSHQFGALEYGPPYFDADADTWVAPADALSIINYINAFGFGPTGEGEASMEATSADAADVVFRELGTQPEYQTHALARDEVFALILAEAADQTSGRNRRR